MLNNIQYKIILELLEREIEEIDHLIKENQFDDREYLEDLIHTKWEFIKENNNNKLVLNGTIYEDKKKYLMED